VVVSSGFDFFSLLAKRLIYCVLGGTVNLNSVKSDDDDVQVVDDNSPSVIPVYVGCRDGMVINIPLQVMFFSVTRYELIGN